LKKSIVAIVACDSYDRTLVESAVRQGVDLIGGIDTIVKSGEKILLKPNILKGAEPDRCVTTHPELFRAVAKILLEKSIAVSYGDSPGDPMSTVGAWKKSGIFAVAEELGLKQGDFDHGQNRSFPRGGVNKMLTIANAVLENDGLISLPKLKTHGLTRMTGAIKNQFGCVPGMLKGQYHAQFPDVFEFSKLLVDINLFIKPRLYVMDAVYAMEGNGPQSGDPKKLGCILVSTDPVAIDTVACHLIALSPGDVPPIYFGKSAGLGTDNPDEIDVRGETVSRFQDKSFNVVRKAPVPLPQNKYLSEIKRLFIPRPVIDNNKCVVCKRCIQVCPVEPKVLTMKKGRKVPQYDYSRCIRCYCCQEMCPEKAISIHTTALRKMLPFLAYLSLFISVFHNKSATKKMIKRDKI
jgi:uncharacterized protein (DUF362 family)/Pyruvate/2-oxoacid:ferredoxin oxidoreductase delta subunit